MTQRIHSKGPYTHEEYVAGEAGIYPGMLLVLQSDDTVDMHAVAGGRGEALFAEEDALQGKTVDDVYTVANIVSCIIPGLGCEVRALIADGEDLGVGDPVVSNGDGCLKALADLDSAGVDVFVIGRMMEAIDLSGSPTGTNGLARVRITAGN